MTSWYEAALECSVFSPASLLSGQAAVSWSSWDVWVWITPLEQRLGSQSRARVRVERLRPWSSWRDFRATAGVDQRQTCVQEEIRAIYLLDRYGRGGVCPELEEALSRSYLTPVLRAWVMALLILHVDVGLGVNAPLRVSCGNLQTLLVWYHCCIRRVKQGKNLQQPW